jgi:hypothetical protein
MPALSHGEQKQQQQQRHQERCRRRRTNEETLKNPKSPSPQKHTESFNVKTHNKFHP